MDTENNPFLNFYGIFQPVDDTKLEVQGPGAQLTGADRGRNLILK
jgi:hypothetical protein